MKIKSLLFLVVTAVLSLAITGCSFLQKKSSQEPLAPQVKAYLDSRVTEAESALDRLEYAKASELFEKFELEFSQNVYLSRSKIGHARALSGEAKNAEALQLYREVIDASLGTNPEFLALASYYSSFSYEALGDENRSFTALNDAKKYENQLPIEIASAELPARLAAYYNRIGEVETSRKYFLIAEKGISVAFSTNSEAHRKARAKSFFQMGTLSTNQLSMESLQAHLDNLSMMQIFLLRSIEINDPQWSPLALKTLQLNYQEIWNLLQQIPKNKALDILAAEQEQRDVQARAMGQLLEMIQKLKLYRAPVEASNGPLLKELFAFVNQLERQAQASLATTPILPLTPEAQQRQSLRRQGTIRSAEVPNSKSGESTNKSPEDPNLQGN